MPFAHLFKMCDEGSTCSEGEPKLLEREPRVRDCETRCQKESGHVTHLNKREICS